MDVSRLTPVANLPPPQPAEQLARLVSRHENALAELARGEWADPRYRAFWFAQAAITLRRLREEIAKL